MGFRKDAYARVWEVTPKGPKNTTLRISISRKNKQTNQYETDFSGFVSVFGTAAEDASKLNVGDTIRLGDCDVGTFKGEQGRFFTNYRLYGFELANRAPQQNQASRQGNYQNMQQPQRSVQQPQYIGYNQRAGAVDEMSETFTSNDLPF